ncbi:MAG: biotin--[acetyl-CoA-carboxylase] ligase [Blautia sp.]
MQKRLEKQLQTKWMGKKLFYREQTESTITWSKEAAKNGCKKELDGAVFLAEAQTRGKGRIGRVWNSPPRENIYMNLLLMEPEIFPENAASLTLVMGLSVAQAAIEVTGKSAGIKWPNDVVMSGKKICGILTEMQVSGTMPKYITIGVGINVNQREFPEELQDKATSLRLEKGEILEREEMAAKTLEYFEKNYEKFLQTQDLSFLKSEYEALLLNQNQPVRLIEKGIESRGIARGITGKGELLVELETGEVKKVLSGEVSVRGLYSYV